MGAYVDIAVNALSLGVQWMQCGDDYGYMVARVDELMTGIRRQLQQPPISSRSDPTSRR
jgi:hypothetical protein